MGDPGLNWTRLSYHTLRRYAECPRAGYFSQAIGIRPLGGETYSDALQAGIVGHALLEWLYHPGRDAPAGLKMQGLDGTPVVRSAADVLDWFMEPQQIDPETIQAPYSASAVLIAKIAFERYLAHYADDDVIARSIVETPELDMSVELRDILPPLQGRRSILYQARADAVVRSPFGGPF